MGMAAIAVGNGLFKANPSSRFLHAMRKTTRVWTVHSPCTHVRQHRLFLLYDRHPVAGREYGWSVAFALSVVGLLITIVTSPSANAGLNSTVQNQTSSLQLP